MRRAPAGAPPAAHPGPAGPAAEEHALAMLTPRMLGLQALSGGVVPLVVYELCRHASLADATALAIAALPPALAVVAEWMWRRRLNVIGAIVFVGILVGLAAVVVLHGSELLLKMRESVVTGLFGVVCLVTLVLPVRPAMFHLGRALAGGGSPQRGEEFAALWEEPRARRTFTVLTAGWGVGLVAEAGLRAILAAELPTGRFLAISPVVGWVVIGGLLYWTIGYARASRRMAEAELASARAPAVVEAREA
jgi:hypothetical protein